MAFRKRILLALIFCFLLHFTKAQFVTIPDANFVTWLNNNGFSSCMNGNQLNASCPAVQNTIALNLCTPPCRSIIYDRHAVNAVTETSGDDVICCMRMERNGYA